MRNVECLFSSQLSVEKFLREYWQKKPFLFRQAITDFTSPVSAETLAGLACEEGVESRLVIEKDRKTPWHLAHGPFVDDDFLQLPETHWTLLVQEANKHIPELSELLLCFNFLPSWWFDDVMISYAPDQGSVGPHFDHYDVFLFQVQGKKQWQINTGTVAEDNFIPDCDLRILANFETECEWLLEPGDILYLPPRVAHYGVSVGDSLTYSIGYRAITQVEMMTAYMEHTIENISNEQHLVVKNLKMSTHSGELTAQILTKITRIIREFSLTDEDIKRWFGRFVTEPKGCYFPVFPDVDIKSNTLIGKLKSGHDLCRGEHSRFNFIRNEDGSAYLYVDSQEYEIKSDLAYFAALLCDQTRFTYSELENSISNQEALTLLVQFYNQGQLYLNNE